MAYPFPAARGRNEPVCCLGEGRPAGGLGETWRSAGDIFAEKGRQFINRSDAEMDSVEARGAHLSPAVRKVLLWTVGLVSFGLALLTITQPFDLEGQVLFLSAMLVLAVLIVQIQARLPLMLLSCFDCGLRALPLVALHDNHQSGLLDRNCARADSACRGNLRLPRDGARVLPGLLGFGQKTGAPACGSAAPWPHVDIFIP